MKRNLIMYSGTNLPELNDKVFEGFESNLGPYYTSIHCEGLIKDLSNDNVVKVDFKPGDKVWYSYGSHVKTFKFDKVYTIEKCSLDEDTQMIKVKGIEGMYPSGIFNLCDKVDVDTNGHLNVFTYDGACNVEIGSILSDYSEDHILEALNKMESMYNNETKETSFSIITKEMNELYKVKNANYGDSFSKQFKEYGLTSSCIRLEDKLNRLKSLNKASSDGTKDESVRDTLIDLANYAVLTIMELDKGGKNEDKTNR